MLVNDQLNTATLIELKPCEDKSSDLAKFLTNGASLVKETEPDTKLWFALKKDDQLFAIFDIFPDEDARQTHFNGEVAKALNKEADTLIIDGWENGVLKNINHFQVLSSKIADDISAAKEAACIILIANPGCEAQLSELLTAAANTIDQTEPNTLFWSALKLSDQVFAIYDVFTDKAAKEDHFNGEVAAQLKDKAESLIQGGWNDGVIANIYHYEVLATSDNLNK